MKTSVLLLSLIGTFTILSALALPHDAVPGAGPGRTIQAEESARKIPFYGKLNALNTDGGTITVGKRVFQVTAETKITKDDKPVTLSAEMIGRRVGGSYVKTADGALKALSVRVLADEKESEDSPRDADKPSAP